MMNLLSSLILLFKTGLGSVVCHGANFIAGINSGYASLVFNNVLNFLADVALRFIWMVEQFVLGIMEMLELVINEFLGIGTTMNDYLSFAEKNEFTSTLVKVFRALLVVALVLMIIFTIYALIRQEREMFKNDGGLSGENKKGPIVKKLFISILVAVLLPFTMIIVIGAVNSVLTSFNNAIKTTSNTSIAGQVLATSTYDTNKYRAYAKQNKRIPIVIQAYNVSDYGADQTDDLLFKIKSFTVQNQLKNTAANIAQGMGLSFAESVTYSNNKLSNSSAYADYYENFICTAEQYEAMADFIDYCEITNTNFYIKAVNDPDVEWKYVDSATFNQNEKILTITYKNASKIGASSLTANALTGNSQSDEVYTLTYSTSYDISSPISDSLDAISALLGINDYKDMLYNTMERDDNFINSVRWANEKVSVHFSENFDISKKETWTSSDQIIMFEYYNFSNANTFSKYSFDDLSYNNRGKVTLDAKKVVYRTYIPEAGAYSHEKEIYCVLINGSYYLVVKSEIEEDEYGNKLFVLKEFEGVDFLETNYMLVNQTSYNTTLVLSQNFNINNSSTWTYTDQLIVFEYYKDLSHNNMFYGHPISDFAYGKGVRVPVYQINNVYEEGQTTNYYALINGTYYQVSNLNNYAIYQGENQNFLTSMNKDGGLRYGYEVKIEDTPESEDGLLTEKYGISTSTETYRVTDFYTETEPSGFDYNNVDDAPNFELCFSQKFNYRDVGTWSFRDYFLFYIYINFLSKSGFSIDTFKSTSVYGIVGQAANGKYYLRVQQALIGNETLFLDMEGVMNISEQNMMDEIDVDETYSQNRFEYLNDLIFVQVYDESTLFSTSEVETKEFRFSEGVRLENIRQWTMEDFILFWLDSIGVINIDKNLNEYVYTSIVFKGISGGNIAANTTKLYSFGMGENKLYLNESYLLKNYNNIDQWLNASLIGYLSKTFSSDSSGNVHSLLLEESAAISSVLNNENINEYVFAFNSILTDILKSNALSSESSLNILEIYDSITPYTYTNPDFNRNDLSTWTQLDFLIYSFTGNANGSYSNYLVKSDLGKSFLIGNHAVKIDGGNFASTLRESATITSATAQNLSASATLDDYKQYYETNLKDDKVVQSNLLTVNLTDFDLLKYNNLTYTFTRDGKNSVLDVLIANFSGDIANENAKLGVYEFNQSSYVLLGNDGVSYYLYKVDGTGIDTNAQINRSATLSLNSVNHIFTKEGTYTYNYFESAESTNQVKFVDAAIYNVSRSTESQTFDIFKSSYGDFICSNGTFILFNEDVRNIGSISNVNSLADLIYKNFYSSYNSKVGVITQSSEITYTFTPLSNDASTWTPLNLIIKNILGTSCPTVSTEISGTLIQSENNKFYFEFQFKFNDGLISTYCVNITDFFKDLEIGMETLTENDEARLILSNRIAFLYNNGTLYSFADAVKNAVTISEVINNNIVSNISDNYQIQLNRSETMVEDDFSTWNWLDLIALHYNLNLGQDTSYTLYTNAAGETFIRLGSSDYVFVNFKSLLSGQNVSKVFSRVEDTEVVFNSNDISVVAIAFFNYTGLDRGTVQKAQITDGGYTLYLIKGEVSNVFVNEHPTSANLEMKSSVELYSYTIELGSSDYKKPAEWNLFDLLIKAANGNVLNISETFTSNIITLGGDEYFIVNGFYINIHFLYSGRLDYDNVNGVRVIKRSNFKNLSNIFETAKINQDSSESSFNHVFFGFDNPDTQIEQNLIGGLTSSPSVDTSNLDKEEIDNLNGIFWLRFSDGFDFSDYSTWKNSDFLLFYLFMKGQLNDKNGDTLIKNFQHYVNQGYVPATIYYLEQFDGYGSVTVTKVYKLGADRLDFGVSFGVATDDTIYSIENIWDYNFINFNLWLTEYQREVQVVTNDVIGVSIDMFTVSDDFDTNTIETFVYEIKTEDSNFDLSFNNYYYFKIDRENSIYKNFIDVSQDVVTNMNIDSSVFKKELFSLKLSENFDVSDISTWTILDAIMMIEYGRETISNNILSRYSLKELKEDYYIYKYIETNGEEVLAEYTEINGKYYCITKNKDGVKFSYNDKLTVSSSPIKSTDILKSYDYAFRVKESILNFNVDSANSLVLVDDANTLVYTLTPQSVSGESDKVGTYYIKLDRNLYQNFKVNFSVLDTYYITSVVKEVNWVQKLMNDLQVIYPDLNWPQLLATGDWLESLGEYHSAYASGQFVASGNSANINAQGLVLSEFLLSIAKESSAGYANYEYSSVFDENTMKSLMLTMMGEENYENLVMQANIFVEMFNTAFAQILDDIAAEHGYDIVEGEVGNLTMSIYKSYLATVLLSSDLGEYLYRVAQRVYSQYAVYESLAFAGDDYANYYAYINGQPNENGEFVDAFRYGTFYDLVIYENKNLRSGVVPVYTFNYVDVFKSLFPDDANGKSDDEILQTMYDEFTYRKVLFTLQNKYESDYLRNRGSNFAYSERNSERYSYLIHVYFSIRQYIYNDGDIFPPTYLTLYKNYIDGNIPRWDVLNGNSIDGSSSLIPKYYLYSFTLPFKSIAVCSKYVLMFKMGIDRNILPGESLDSFVTRFQDVVLDTRCPYYLLKDVFNGTIYADLLYETFFVENQSFIEESLPLSSMLGKFQFIATDSESGDLGCWNQILKNRDNLAKIIDEFMRVMELETGEKTESGATKVFTLDINDGLYEKTLIGLQELYDAYESYISTQESIDTIIKSSVTFALAQYSNNYVESGFEFTINQKKYTLDTSVSVQRLAEYVYGGAYLSKYGITPKFTDDKFEGIIDATKVYDSDAGAVLVKVNSWAELKQFASKIADYTAKLYFTTNLSDLSENVSDSLLLSETFGVASQNSTIEYKILEFILQNEYLSGETMLRLTFGDDSSTLEKMNCNNNNIKNIARFLEGQSVTEFNNEKNIYNALKEYLNFVYGSNYIAGGYYNIDGTVLPNQRIHRMFVNVLSYITLSDEQQQNNSEIGVEGEFFNFDNLTFKDFKLHLMKSIINYEKNPQETGDENTNRYLTLFNLISCQCEYYTNGTTYIGTTLDSINKVYDPTTGYVQYKSASTNARVQNLNVNFGLDLTTRGTIQSLCGAENRPIEELVNLEYNDVYESDGNYDENKGDIFVVCSYDYDTGKYIPFMATNHENSGKFGTDSNYFKYLSEQKHNIYTDAYVASPNSPKAYPIVAKGIVTADMKPTAIRSQNNIVSFYRTDITATTNVGEDALARINATVETSTIGYVNYVNKTTFSNVASSSESKTMFIGASNIMTYISSDADVYYVQYNNVFNLDKADEFDGISVLSQFSAFFRMTIQMNFMMILGFITLIPLLFKASAAVLKRIIDLIFLLLIGPLCISMNMLGDGNSEHNAYSTWKQNMIQTLLNVFGLVITFNLYFIMVSAIMNMTFVTEGDSTMMRISLIGGLSFVTAPMLNFFIRFIFIIIATNMIQTAADMLGGIVTADRISNSLGSPIGGGTNPIDSIISLKNQFVGDINKALTNIQGVVSGKIFIEAASAIAEGIPGVGLVRGAKEKVGSIRNLMKSRELYKQMREKGMSRTFALTAAATYRSNYKKRQRQIKQRRKQNAQNFYSRFK